MCRYFLCLVTCQHFCTNENLLYVFVDREQLGRQVWRDISVLSSAMATINTTCEDCQFNYWEVIAKFHSKDVLYYQFLEEPSVLGVQCCKWAAVVQWNRCALGSLGSQSSQVDSHNGDHSCEFFKSLSDVTTSSAECHP